MKLQIFFIDGFFQKDIKYMALILRFNLQDVAGSVGPVYADGLNHGGVVTAPFSPPQNKFDTTNSGERQADGLAVC